MRSLALNVSLALGLVVGQILLTSLVLVLVAALVLTSALAIGSVLDVAFYVIDAVHESADEMVMLSAGGPGVDPGVVEGLHGVQAD